MLNYQELQPNNHTDNVLPLLVLQGVLWPAEIKMLMAAKHKPNFILQILSELVEHSCIVSPERFRMDQNVTFLHDALGACERILKTPIPLSYTRYTLSQY